MCGIYTVVLQSEKNNSEKNQDAGKKVLDGLKRLEYRGYDSWGVAVVANDKIEIEKRAGKIGDVVELTLPEAKVAIGHTRWATHGGVTDINAHPHLATDGSFALAQNGVVENYQELKAKLIKENFTFISQTDTEVIVRQIEKMAGDKRPITFALVGNAFRQLAGRNTITILTREGNVFAVRDGSPLVVGKDEHGNLFLSSDVVSLAADASLYYPLESREGVEIVDGEVKLYDIDTLKQKELQFHKIDVESLRLDKGGFPHFMIKEIYEQAEVLGKPLVQPTDLFEKLVEKISGARNVFTVGAGSADFVSGQLSFSLRQRGVHATAVKAYESRSFKTLVEKGDVCIAVSQSGETADTVEVVEWMKAKGATIASIVNMPGSTLSRLSDLPFMLQIGPEIGIASTKAVASMMVWGMAVAALVGGEKLEKFQAAVQKYEKELKLWFAEKEKTQQFQKLADQFTNTRDLFVLGRGQLYMSAFEAALKLKEISYIHAEGFSGGELKHGVIALIEKGTPVMCLIANDGEKNDMLSAAAEVKARGARVIGVAAEHNSLFDEWIAIPNDQQFIAVSSFIPAQLLTYELALKKNLDPDKPRNLAKSVTVK